MRISRIITKDLGCYQDTNQLRVVGEGLGFLRGAGLGGAHGVYLAGDLAELLGDFIGELVLGDDGDAEGIAGDRSVGQR